jgi:predicted Rossmann-fold nucleotide-binding protein
MRKFWFIYKTKGIVVWPGGFGTLDELFDVLTLLQCRKVTRKIPIILFGTQYWEGLIDWQKMVDNKTISSEDLDLFVTLDSIDEAYDYLINNMQK